MKPGRKALKATQALSARLKSVWKVLDRTDAKLTELRNINRNLFRVVNELRESNSKEPLDLGYLEDFSSAWDETEDGKYE
jgi:predicted P-loop ATPase